MSELPRIIRWEDPPPARNGRGAGGRPLGSRWDEVAETLRDEPGRWAVIVEGTAAQASAATARIRLATARCFAPAGTFEARVRSDTGGVHTVYARHVGGECR